MADPVFYTSLCLSKKLFVKTFISHADHPVECADTKARYFDPGNSWEDWNLE